MYFIVFSPQRCYGCINFSEGLKRKKKHAIYYVSGPNADFPQDHSDLNPPPRPPSPDRQSQTTHQTGGTDFTDPNDPDHVLSDDDDDYVDDDDPVGPQRLTQIEMDYLVARMKLSQRMAVFLTSFLKRRNLTMKKVKVTSYRKRYAQFKKFYTLNETNSFAYCNDVKGVVNLLGMEYIADE